MIKSTKNGDELTVYLRGEIDHFAAQRLRADIEQLLGDNKTRRLVLDFGGVTFMDSSGVGMIIGRYKTMVSRGGTVMAQELHPPVDQLFRMAGLHRIIAKKHAERQEDTQ